MKVLKWVGIMVFVALLGAFCPCVALVSSGQTITSINFEDDFAQIAQKIPECQQATVRSFASVFGVDGKVERFEIRAEVMDGQGYLLYNIAYHPNLGLYTIKRSKLDVDGVPMPHNQISLELLSKALSHINFEEALKVRKSLRCNVMVGSMHTQTKPYNAPHVESYVIDGEQVKKLDQAKAYPESTAFFVADEKGVLVAYYVI